MGWYGLVVGLFVFLIVLNTITIGLRVFVRTKLTKGAFGWDDVALIFSYVSFPWRLETSSLTSLFGSGKLIVMWP